MKKQDHADVVEDEDEDDTDTDTAAKKGDIPLGAAGLVLVLLGLLQFASGPSLTAWFFSSLGIFACFVGAIISIAGIVKDSGRLAGFVGVLAFAAIRVGFLFAK